MSTDTRLRAAYDHLAERAPEIADLELDFTGSIARQRARAQHGRHLRVALAAASVVAVAAASMVIAGRGRPNSQPPASPAVPAVAWAFGPDSLPDYQGDFLQLTGTGQVVTYFAAGAAQAPGGRANLDVFAPDAAQRQLMARLSPVRVRGVAGWVGTLRTAPDCGLLYSGGYCPSAVVVWPLSDRQWSVITAESGFDKNNNPVSASQQQLVHLANTLVPAHEPHVAFLRVGYLPASLRLVTISYDRGDDYGIPTDGYASRGYQTMAFSADGQPRGAEVNVSIAHEPARPLAEMTAASLAADDHPGPWTRTTVQGHLAWSSPTDILIQWGPLTVAVDNGKSIPGGSDSLPATSQAELLKVANSLTVPDSDAFGAGYPLAEALPPGAGW